KLPIVWHLEIGEACFAKGFQVVGQGDVHGDGAHGLDFSLLGKDCQGGHRV
ncbi:MAG: hypothetical protein RLZZ152_2369, partial [Pseudomonadota bacterium]